MPRAASFAIFLGIFSVFLYVANLVVYEALAALFQLTAASQLLTLGIVLGILSASFIAANVLGMRYYNAATRVYYTLSASWIGAFCYLFFASVAYGILVGIAPKFSNAEATEYAGIALFAAAIMASAYGLLHAQRIKVKKVTITLPRLPLEWKNKQAIWISDVHLGQVHGPRFARKVVSAVNAERPDIIFVGGDLYDGTGAPDPYDLAEPFIDMRAPWGVYFITGNHEEFGDSSRFLQAVRDVGMQVLMDEMVAVHGVAIIGVDYKNASNAEHFKNTLSSFALTEKMMPSILLKHEPKDLQVAADAGVSLNLSGHTHYGQQWPFGLLAQLVYKGFAYGLKNHGRLQVLTSSGVGTWGPPLRVGSDSELVEITFA